MAKAKGRNGRMDDGESVSAYFRRLFSENRRRLKERSNEWALEQWRNDHPGVSKVPQTVKNVMSNIKSQLRPRKGRRGRPAADVSVETAVRAPIAVLERLEEKIDECLTAARVLGTEVLDDVIRHLRRARNEVVWKQGH